MTYQRSPKQTHLGPMSKNSAHLKHFIPERVELDIPTRVTNSSSLQPLRLAAMWAGSESRPGCQDHRQFKSLSFASAAAEQKEPQ